MSLGAARQRLIDWANAQEHWVRAIAAEAFATRAELPPGRIAELYDAFAIEKGLKPGKPPAVPPLEGGGLTQNAAERLELTSLSAVANVNALAGGQRLTFAPRLTVVFGENASGKTGYARILKRLAAVRTAEPVLPDVRSEDTSAPRATVEYRLGGDANTLEWSGEAGVAPFTRLSVFDARAVSVHADEDLTYVVTPADLALYRYVHRGLEAVRVKLEAQLAERQGSGNPVLPRLQRDALVYPKVEALGATADLTELEALAVGDPQELAALRERAGSVRPGAARDRLKAAASDAELHGALVAVAGALKAFDWAGHEAAAAAVRKTAAAREKAADDALSADEIPGASGPAWRAFMEAAEAYLAEVGETSYPHRGDDCLYCRQPLKPAATALLKRYRRVVKDETRAEHEAALAEHAELKARIAALPIKEVHRSVAARLDSVGEQGDGLLARAVELFELAAKTQRAALDGKKVDAAALTAAAAEVERQAATAKKASDALVASLKRQASDRAEEHEDAAEQLRQLENRLALKAQWKELERWLEQAKWMAKAAQVSSRLSSLLRSLTEQAKQASEEALNQDFERRFAEECEHLRAPRVELDFSGKKGVTARRKLLGEHRLSELLSEGEQNVIALADFLAELMLQASAAPVVLDDPVNSLDAKRREHVAERLVQLSETRQVIVFTHDAELVAALRARLAEGQGGCAFLQVRAEGGQYGLVGPGVHS